MYWISREENMEMTQFKKYLRKYQEKKGYAFDWQGKAQNINIEQYGKCRKEEILKKKISFISTWNLCNTMYSRQIESKTWIEKASGLIIRNKILQTNLLLLIHYPSYILSIFVLFGSCIRIIDIIHRNNGTLNLLP